MFWPATVTNVASVFASTAARSNENSGTRASNVVVSDSAPLSLVRHARPDERAVGLQLRPVAGDGGVDLRDPGKRRSDDLADLLQARRIGVQREVGLIGVVQRQRAGGGDVDVAAHDFELADLGGPIAVVGVDRCAGDLQAADGRRLERHPARRFDAFRRDAGRHVPDARLDIQLAGDGALRPRRGR